MEISKIYIKENKSTGEWQRITALSNSSGITIYNYYDGKNDDAKKSTFNKYVMIAYLESIGIAKKYIKQVENI